MPEVPNKFFLTTPIYYVNARPHIGHAYTTIVGDVLARRSRAQGIDTWFLTGTDEHGQKIERSALAAGVPPQQFTDQVAAQFRTLWQRMGITNDDFIRTTEPRHTRGAQKLFADLHAAGHIYLSTYTGQYSIGEEMFVEGPPGTIGPDGRPTETVTEENFFFRLSAFQLPLIDLIESNTLKIHPESSRNEVISFICGSLAETMKKFMAETGRPTLDAEFSGSDVDDAVSAGYLLRTANHLVTPGALRDLSVSRSSFTWGIPVPEPAASEASQKHVIYVWLDALANYMTAVGYGSEAPEDQAKFARFWPADLHLVGKEITRFHCVYWPAFLLAAGLPLPKGIVANGWLLFDNSKMSKSKGNIVRTETILDAFGTLCPAPIPLSSFAEGAESASPTSNAVILSKRSESKDPEESHTAHIAGDHSATTGAPSFSELHPGKGGVSDEVPPLSPKSPTQPGAPFISESHPGMSGITNPEPASAAPATESPTKHQRDLFAADVLRYYLLREIPFGQDGSFSFEALITRYNADLANGYGNLVSRTLKMIQNWGGAHSLSEYRSRWSEADWIDNSRAAGTMLVSDPNGSGTSIEDATRPLLWHVVEHTLSVRNLIAGQHGETDFNEVLAHINLAISVTDKFLSSQAPWKMAAGIERDEVLYIAAESIRIITLLLYPILPYSTAAVWRQLGLDEKDLTSQTTQRTTDKGQRTTLTWGGLKPGTKLGPLAPIFPRADKGLAQIMTDMETEKTTQATPENTSLTGQRFEAPAEPHHAPTDPAAGPRTASFTESNPGSQVAGSTAHTTERPGTPPHTQAQASGIFSAPFIPEPHPGMSGSTPVASPATGPANSSPQITIDDFAKVELRVAQILVCERIPKADKLLRLEVDLGYEKRQILSGIAEWYTPEELIGRRIVVITNLAPRKMRGLESHGMLLAASAEPSAEGEKPGKPHLATFAGADSEALPLGSRLR